MHKLTVTTIIKSKDYGVSSSVAVTSHTIDFNSALDMNKYLAMMEKTDLRTKLDVSIHRFIEGHND